MVTPSAIMVIVVSNYLYTCSCATCLVFKGDVCFVQSLQLCGYYSETAAINACINFKGSI